jgi:hypothetical protein
MKKPLLFILCCLLTVSVARGANHPPTLEEARQQVSSEFARLDAGLKRAAGQLGTTGLTGNEARRVLRDACTEFDYAVDCCTIDSRGTMTTVEPPQYRHFEGKDISGQSQVKRMLRTRKPVLSSVFRAVEGYEAVDVEYPVFNPDGTFIGSVSILFKPEKFLADIVTPLVKGGPVDIWAMEKGGRILYDADSTQVGLNLFSAELYRPYRQLVILGKKMAVTTRGEGSYRFRRGGTNGQEVLKKAYWQSVSLYGTSWRLIGIQVVQETKRERREEK